MKLSLGAPVRCILASAFSTGRDPNRNPYRYVPKTNAWIVAQRGGDGKKYLSLPELT